MRWINVIDDRKCLCIFLVLYNFYYTVSLCFSDFLVSICTILCPVFWVMLWFVVHSLFFLCITWPSYVLMFSVWNLHSVYQHSTAVPQSPYYSHYLITRSTDNAETCYSCLNVSGKYTFGVYISKTRQSSSYQCWNVILSCIVTHTQ